MKINWRRKTNTKNTELQNFLIEFRLHGYAKYYTKGLHKEISKLFGLKSGQRIIPHITLYGPATTNDIKHAISIVQRIGQKYQLVPFTINGFSYFNERSNVVSLDIEPSPELKSLRWELSEALQKISSCQQWDKSQEFKFHSTIILGFPHNKLSQIWNYIQQKKAPNIQQHLLRMTVLGHNRKIIYEYDLVLKKIFNRTQALSRYSWRATINKYRDLRLLKFRDTSKSIFFIGDLHLDHANIIKYCRRPFSDVRVMNRILISNWKRTVKDDGSVYFLGDLAFGRGSRPPEYWLSKLTGDIHYIKGNHEDDVKNSKEYEILEFEGYKFLMLHNPVDLPIEWDGWIIHGHKHNNDIKNYPFINGEKKTINVSAELIDYKPISLSSLLDLDLDSIQRMDTIKSKPKRWKY